jgi:stage V sporulation protein S
MHLVWMYNKHTAWATCEANINRHWRDNMDANLNAPNEHGSAKDLIRVAATSRTSAVAGAIAGVIRQFKHAEVLAIGAGAVNQAVKALVLATGYLKEDGINVACIPEFVDVTIKDKVRTAIKLVIDPR